MKSNLINLIVSTISFLNISVLFKGLNDAFHTDSDWISDEAKDILRNPEDRKKIEEAIKQLKKGEPTNPIKLSSGRTININID